MPETNTPYIITPEPQPLRSMLLFFGIVMLGMTLGGLLVLVVVSLGSSVKGQGFSVNELLVNPASVPNGWWWLMGVQAVSHVCSFLLPSLLYWQWVDRRTLADFNFRNRVLGWWLVVPIVLSFGLFNGYVIEWNQHMHLPDTLAPLERWMRQKEDDVAKLTQFLTTISGVPQLLMALLVVAILPGIGEEVLFRGVLQRKFIAWSGGNVHVGIWLAAALFSAIHLQFYGFVPRMLLGGLFGYLYVWTGNLWIPILAHFVNNGLAVVVMALNKQKMTTIDLEANDIVPLPVALLAAALSVVLALRLKRLNE
ncbi:CPBP family intramembrane glutamic endopeptidase [Fibrella aquatilis]|uniref:CPBP family intramembrane metalloprotease n=1 Tax=Fibrella aquatilis TaxID=2817059 RepID=A0A939G6T0_9BACT|nr:CPBP family intramembrane glutamic endopeptidase [Fibrella aquatilis]MBO0933462.1 CPBP family intramembrane metalloprotease [Fibrella aquatilis]